MGRGNVESEVKKRTQLFQIIIFTSLPTPSLWSVLVYVEVGTVD